jgi:hypothetical protein
VTIFKIIAVLTGLVIAGEAVALLAGMHLFVRPVSPWLTPKNNVLAVIDMITGIIIVALAITGKSPVLFYAAVVLALITHGFRDWEYLASAELPFIFNLPLFIVNNLKLAGVIAVAVLKVGTCLA